MKLLKILLASTCILLGIGLLAYHVYTSNEGNSFIDMVVSVVIVLGWIKIINESLNFLIALE